MAMLDSKATWPGWRTVREIGRGSYGAVYEIERDLYDEVEKAALKVISFSPSDNEIDELRLKGNDDNSITNTFNSYRKDVVSEYALMRKLNGTSNVVNCDGVDWQQHKDGYGWDVRIKVVFHSLRHSSITYKLKLNGGDIKAVQGDSGHSQTSMVTDVYSHIIDEDRRANAMLFEDMFYKKKEADPEVPKEGEKTGLEGAEAELLGKILSNPEAMALLRALTKTL